MFSINHAAIWRLAGPLIASNISVALLGTVDTAVVGHLGDPVYLGAVAIAAVIFNFLYWSMAFLRMGTTGIVAQIHGRDRRDEMRAALSQAISVAAIISIIILILQQPIVMVGLNLTGGSEEVKFYAERYYHYAIWGAPAVLISMAIMGWLLGMQNARATLIITTLVNVINIILDFVFVFGFDMNVRGVALASVISQYVGLITGLYLVHKHLQHYPGEWSRSLILNFQRLREMLFLNQNIFLRTLCIIFTFAFFTRQGAEQGDVVLAANAILLNFVLFLALGLDGFANAAEAMVGKAIGAVDRDSFRQAIVGATLWALIIAVGFSMFYILLGSGLVNLMTDLQTVRDEAHRYLIWLVLTPLVSVWCFLLDGIFIGAMRGREMRNSMFISTFIVFLPVWYISQSMGNHGLWLAMMSFFIARGLSLGVISYRIEKHQGGFIPHHA